MVAVEDNEDSREDGPDDKPEDGSAPPGLESISFEEAFNLLNQMAEDLEAGGLSLADATARFEQGMKLVERCNRLLNTAETKITQLRDSYRDGASAPVLNEDLEWEE